MKKQIIIALALFFMAGNMFSQFTLEKFLNEKLSLFDSQKYTTMANLTKKIENVEIEKVPVKAEYLVLAGGSIMRQSLTTTVKDAKLRTKLFDLLFAELSKRITKTERDETYEGIRNVVWRAADNTLYTLSKSPALASLTMVKMQ